MLNLLQLFSVLNQDPWYQDHHLLTQANYQGNW